MRWNKEEVKFLIENIDKLSKDEICSKLNRSKDSINKKIRVLNLKSKNRESWSDKDIEFLINNYAITDNDIISKKLNRSINSIFLKASKLNLKKEIKKTGLDRKYNFNKDYFKNIDSNNKAYYLGWALTDGNVVYGDGYTYRIRLSTIDIDILEKFKTDLHSDVPILFRESNKYCEINICSKQFTENLINLGCIPNKTFDVEFPDIKDEFIWDFLKGLFDGDGCYVCTDKTYKIQFASASKSLIDGVSNVLSRYDIKYNISSNKNRFYKLEISSRKHIKDFLNYIVNTKSDFLDRKYRKMLLMLDL